jgi:ATP-dependent protease Clp ATPase subunit
MEEHLMEIMYQIPDMEGVERVVMTKDTILHGKDPIFKAQKKRRSA